MTPRRQEMGICNSHFSLLLLASLLSPLPSSAHTWNRSQIISSTLSVVRQLLSLLVTSSAPATSPCSTLSGPSSIIPILHTVGVIAPLVVSAYHSHLFFCWCATVWPISLGIIFLLLVCNWLLSAHQGAAVLVICRGRGDRKTEAETRGTHRLSVCSSQTGSLNERSHPSSVSTLCLFPPHHSPSPLRSSS